MTISHGILVLLVLLLNLVIIVSLWALFTGRLSAWFRRMFQRSSGHHNRP